MEIIVCQHCDTTIEIYEDVKVNTRYTVCGSCQEEERLTVAEDD